MHQLKFHWVRVLVVKQQASYSVCIGYFAGAGIGNGIGNTIMLVQ
jgi:hypothetical protein